MERLSAALEPRYQRLRTLWVLIPALAAALVFTVLFEVAHRMVTADGPSVIALQRAFTTGRFESVIAAWGKGVAQFKTNTMVLDFAFPLLYAAALSSLVALARGPRPGRVALGAFALPWGAALCDWLENTLHLWLLADVPQTVAPAAAEFSAPVVLLASALAMLKYTALLLAALGAAAWGIRTRRWWAGILGMVFYAVFLTTLLS